MCKGKQRCGKSSGEHEYEKCERGAELKCCSFEGGGGGHSLAYRGYGVSTKRAEEMQRVKVSQGITYVKKVAVQPDKDEQ